MRKRMIISMCVVALLAISLTEGRAACLSPPASDQLISQFKSNPRALVAPDSDSRTIEATTRDLVGTDASLAADFVRIAKGTIPRYQTAIAAGLAQAAIACSTVDQQAALLIQQAVAGFEDGQFQASFAAVAGDLSTAATEAATAFATGSVGSVVVTNPTTSPAPTITPGGGAFTSLVQLTTPGLTISTNGTSTMSTSPNSTSTTAATPVSASR